MKLRLLITDKCNRDCEGCCNKEWDLDALPKLIPNKLINYDEVLLTGGEPMLNPYRTYNIARQIKRTASKLYLYTAKVDDWKAVLSVLHIVDGITLTLHDQSDVAPFIILNELIQLTSLTQKSLRLNIFKGIDIGDFSPNSYNNLNSWKVKDNIEWRKNCPLPADEIFMRL